MEEKTRVKELGISAAKSEEKTRVKELGDKAAKSEQKLKLKSSTTGEDLRICSRAWLEE